MTPPAGDVRVSVAVMHHPARAAILGELLARCDGLAPRVVVDPDPTGIRSPLRTAKRAWAAVADGATHHLVLQDDARPRPGFAEAMRHCVRARPDHALAFYTNGSSPQNAYLVRRAVALGLPFAPLSVAEWAPTQALLLPAALARELAGYLATLADDLIDDDRMIARFCRARRIPIRAAVPHLVDNAALPTITTGHAGAHRATVPAPAGLPDASHWTAYGWAEEHLADGCAHRLSGEYVLEFTRSRCMVRLIRPGTGEPAGHHFQWYWADWCPLVGVRLDRMLDEAGRLLSAVDTDNDPAVSFGVGAEESPWRLAVEVWAAAYLLGHDIAVIAAPAVDRGRVWPEPEPHLVRDMLRSWVESGLSAADRARLTGGRLAALADLAVTALHAGRSDRDDRSDTPRSPITAAPVAGAAEEDTRHAVHAR